MGCFGYICPECETQIIGGCWGGGEECILIHVREGKELGRAVGHYGEYGNVLEDEKFRGDDKDDINGHSSICDSEMNLDSSMNFGGLRELPNGETINIRNWYDTKELATAFVEFGNYPNLPSNATYWIGEILRETQVFILEINVEIAQDELTKNTDQTKENELKAKLDEATKKFNHYKENPMKDLITTDDFQKEMYGWANKLPVSKKATSGIIAYHKVCYDKLENKEISNLKLSLPDPDQSWGNPRAEFGGTPSDDWESDELLESEED